MIDNEIKPEKGYFFVPITINIKKLLSIRIIGPVVIASLLFTGPAYSSHIDISGNLRIPLANNSHLDKERQVELQRLVFLKLYGLSRFLTKNEALDYLDSVEEIMSLHTGQSQRKKSVKQWLDMDMALMAEKNDGSKVVISAPLVAKTKLVPATALVSNYAISGIKSMALLIAQRFPETDNISFVDLDTGTGEFVTGFKDYLLKYYRNVDPIGVELLEDLVEEAKTNGHNVVRVAPDISEDYKDAGLSDNSKDIVTINNIESRPWALIAQADRIVKPSGLIIVTFEKYDILNNENNDKRIDVSVARDLTQRGYNVARISFPADYPRSEVYVDQADFILIAWKGNFDALKVLNKTRKIQNNIKSNL